ncbi:MAG: DUF4238 domain-containing protein [Chitinophagaceae bacterium]|nr:DUF4238 domain-containing protein [Chitinophagaceae bacterium]
MNQHFVPELYLKNFSPNGKQIFVYDKTIEKSFSSSISSVASHSLFYRETGEDSLEARFGLLETKISPIIASLIENLENDTFSGITSTELSLLAQFV